MSDIERAADGSTIFSGKGVEYFRLSTLLSALRLQARGIKFTRRSIVAAARRMGYTGRTAAAMIPQVEADLEKMRSQVTVSPS